MSFRRPYDENNACALPCADVPLIAPIWIDLDFENFGLLHYRVSQDPTTMERVKSLVTEVNPALSSYQPTLAVIVTWFEGTPVFRTSVGIL